MAPTDRVHSKRISTPTKKLAKIAAPEPRTDTTELPQILNGGKKHTALDNFTRDLEIGKMEQDLCYRYMGFQVNPFCKDKYIYYPDPKETYGNFQDRYKELFKPGDLRTGGQAYQVPGNPEISEIIFPMKFDKADFDERLGIKQKTY